eukprot:s2346_g11.t1
MSHERPTPGRKSSCQLWPIYPGQAPKGPPELSATLPSGCSRLLKGTSVFQTLVTSLRLLKIDTEGLDALILRQMLRYGEEVGFFPDRVQFERNNLTDLTGSQQTFDALQAAFDCWIPPAEDPLELSDDVHCLRLVDIAPSRPTMASGGEVDPPWVRVELPDRLPVAGVRLPGGFLASPLNASVGDSRDASHHRLCGTLRPTLHGIAAVRCPAGVEGRFLTLTGPTAATPQASEGLKEQSFRLF